MKRRFSPTRHLRRSDGLDQVEAGGAGHEWIVARELCAHTVIDASAVPANRRRDFAATAVRRWSPFADPQSHLEWVGDRAMVWAWSRSRVLGDAEAAPVQAQPRRLYPETLFRGEPHASGEELVAMDQGFEGRAWRNHLLAASTWWPAVPALADWNAFLRGAGLPTMAEVPVALEAPLATSPWNARRPRDFGEMANQHRGLLVAGVAGIVVAVLTSSLVAALALAVSIGQVEDEIAAQDESLQRILAAREQAGRDADAISDLLALRPPASQVELIAEAASLLPPGGDWQLLEWRMPDPGKFELDLRMPQADPAALVEAWEAAPRFSGVTVDLLQAPGEIGIRADIDRLPVAGQAGEGAP